MTKADLVPEGADQRRFLNINGAGDVQLDYGFHITVMNPDTALTHERASQKEARFFKKASWRNLGPEYQSRLGVKNLSGTLYRLLQAEM
jgi:hypothetical protein